MKSAYTTYDCSENLDTRFSTAREEHDSTMDGL